MFPLLSLGRGILLWGVMIKSLLMQPSISAEIDLQALDEFLFYQFVPHPRTMLRGVAQLPPGCSLRVEQGRLDVRRYWELPFEPDEDSSDGQHQQNIELALRDAVGSHMVSDVPVGVFLSGGIDSSLVAAVAQDLATQPLHTFSIAFDDKGRLLASDQGNKGLYRLTLPGIGSTEPTRVEKLKLNISSSQGMLHALGSLFISVNGGPGSGLYRARDTNGDDQYDELKLLRKLNGGGEHGPHAVRLGPDGQSIYVIAGNHTNPPEFDSSLLPSNWGEDLLLPRQWDARGHAFVAETSMLQNDRVVETTGAGEQDKVRRETLALLEAPSGYQYLLSGADPS